MISKLSKWLEQSDNEFLKGLSNIEDRQRKIQVLKQSRTSLLILATGVGIIFCSLFFQSPESTLFLIFLGFMFVIYSVTYAMLDSQIKMLLLYDKTQTE